MRALGISLLSVALTTTVIANAYYQKKQFYPSVVYITKSNPSMAVMYIQAFIVVFLTGKLMRKIFFGQLRTAEFEHLMERAWYAITETCLAFTVFRDDFNPKFVALFTLLLFLKSFHWLAEDRVDYMERSPVISWLFHLRVVSLLAVLGSLDFYFVQHAYLSTMTKGASVQLVFGFEYAILLTMIMNILIKYVLHTIDLNSETPWENKAVFLLYTELIMGLKKVILYVTFVVIMVKIYTLPLFAFRPMYYTIRNFKKAFNDVILSRRAIHNMNTLYPDATPEELGNADIVCIICREEMTTASKKLPCNHIFHTTCLRSWFQRQQTCPTCRLNILSTNTNPTSQQQRQDQRPRVPPVVNPFAGPNPFINFNPFPHLFNQPNPNPQVPPPDLNQPLLNPPGQGQIPQNAAPGNAQQQPNVPPFGLPPMMPFPILPFLSPPPLPPNYLRTLSMEELRRIEGEERQHVEARIECLRNIQVMLDTAVLMMQQYSASVSAATMPSTSQVPPSAAPAADATVNNDPTTTSTTNNASENANVANPSTTTLNNNEGCACGSGAETKDVSPQTSENEVPTVLSPEEEIRRRRLQRFQQDVE